MATVPRVEGAVTGVGGSTREKIVVAAERLFAQHGIEGVSLRQILAAAGQANMSAIQYHFGSKQKLVDAVFVHRLPRIDRRREVLLAKVDGAGLLGDPRVLLGVLALPLAEEAANPESHYVSFAAQLTHHPSVIRPVRELERSPHGRSWRQTMRLLSAALEHVPEPLRSRRIHRAHAFYLHVLADWERAIELGEEVDHRLPQLLCDVLDVLTAGLSAPASAYTTASPTGASDESAETSLEAAVFGSGSARASRAEPGGDGGRRSMRRSR